MRLVCRLLRNNIWTNPNETPGNGVDDDRNGYVDDVHGWDFANNDASVYDPDPVSGAGDEHGTHVAGTIAAEGNNGVGVAGVSWRARIMPLKFLGPNGGYTSDAVEALNYAVAKGARISNNSWGGGGFSQSLLDAIKGRTPRATCSWQRRGTAARTVSATTTTRPLTTPPTTTAPTSSPWPPPTTRTPSPPFRTTGPGR